MTTTLSPDQVARTTRVLVIGDDPSSPRRSAAWWSQQNGTGVVVAATGATDCATSSRSAPTWSCSTSVSPSMDGWEVLERIRDLSEVPVLVLTAHDFDQERGARPAGRRRRPPGQAVRGPGARRPDPGAPPTQPGRRRPAPPQPAVYRDGNLEVDWPAREVRVDGEVVGLTKLEFQLLQTFVRHPGQALSTQQLLEQVWNDPFGIGPERVKFTVLRLRRKLGWQDEHKDVLEAIRGYGYRYTPVATARPLSRVDAGGSVAGDRVHQTRPGAPRPPGAGRWSGSGPPAAGSPSRWCRPCAG